MKPPDTMIARKAGEVIRFIEEQTKAFDASNGFTPRILWRALGYQWTKEKPQDVGHYWVRQHDTADAELITTFRDAGVLKVELYDQPVADLDWLWLGPLQAPPR